MWAWQAARGTEPFTISKMTFACVCVAIAYLIMAAAALIADGGKASPLWLVGYFAVVTLGELYLSPIGLSLMSKSAPVRARQRRAGYARDPALSGPPVDRLDGALHRAGTGPVQGSRDSGRTKD
jgi:hypothetical protein